MERLDDVGHISTKLENKQADRETKESFVQDAVLESVMHKQQPAQKAEAARPAVGSSKKLPK